MTDATTVFFRRRGTQTWVQATPVQIGEDTNPDSHFRPAAGVIQIAIEIRDEQGNTVSWETPAFTTTSERVPTGKRRSVR